MFIYLLLGPLLACVATSSIWMAVGRGQYMQRVTISQTITTLLGLGFCALSGEFEAEWLWLFWIVAILIAASFTIARSTGLLIHESRSHAKENQFSLGEIFSLLTAAAVGSIILGWLKPVEPTTGYVVAGISMAVLFAVLAFGAVWSIQRRLFGITIHVIATIALAIAAFVGMEVTDANPGGIWAMIVLTYGAAVLPLVRAAYGNGLFPRLLRPQ